MASKDNRSVACILTLQDISDMYCCVYGFYLPYSYIPLVTVQQASEHVARYALSRLAWFGCPGNEQMDVGMVLINQDPRSLYVF